MSDETPRPHHLFIVRVWREPGRSLAEDQWRGSVEHVPSGQRRYFTTGAALTHFVWLQLDGAQPSVRPELWGHAAGEPPAAESQE